MLIPLAIFGLSALAACSDSTLEDLPNSNQAITQQDVIVYQAPDQFPNVTFYCNGKTGVYLTTREQGQNMQLVPGDTACSNEPEPVLSGGG